MWAVKILLTLRKAAEAGVPPMKSSELLAACVAPHADTYMHKVNKRYDALTREYLSSIYVDELDSPALSERSRAKLPHMNLQTTEHAEQHT